MSDSRVKQAVYMIGGPKVAADICGVSIRAVYKWLDVGRLPRSAYTGEKPYAEILAKHCDAKFTAAWLLSTTETKAA